MIHGSLTDHLCDPLKSLALYGFEWHSDLLIYFFPDFFLQGCHFYQGKQKIIIRQFKTDESKSEIHR